MSDWSRKLREPQQLGLPGRRIDFLEPVGLWAAVKPSAVQNALGALGFIPCLYYSWRHNTEPACALPSVPSCLPPSRFRFSTFFFTSFLSQIINLFGSFSIISTPFLTPFSVLSLVYLSVCLYLIFSTSSPYRLISLFCYLSFITMTFLICPGLRNWGVLRMWDLNNNSWIALGKLGWFDYYPWLCIISPLPPSSLLPPPSPCIYYLGV